MKVYAAIQAVMKAVGVIGKTKTNPQQNYKFRGIDVVMAELQGHLVAHGLVIVPRVLSAEREMLDTKSGGRMASVRLTVEHDFIAVEDGSKVTVCTIGEAMDSGDKASNKAMSAAYKYAVTLGFCIPTEEPKDTEDASPELAPRPAASTKASTRPATSAVFPNWGSCKGQPISGAKVRDLNWYRDAIAKNIADPEKARWKDANQQVLNAIEAELAMGAKQPGDES